MSVKLTLSTNNQMTQSDVGPPIKPGPSVIKLLQKTILRRYLFWKIGINSTTCKHGSLGHQGNGGVCIYGHIEGCFHGSFNIQPL